MPRPRNTRARAKDTSRSDARRRYKEEQRAAEVDADAPGDQAEPAPAPTARTQFRLPDVRADIAALPGVFRKPLVWLPFGMLVLAFVLELARQNGALPAGGIGDIAVLYVQLTLPPAALFVFFIGGFVAPRASYLVGAILGVFDALLITILVTISPVSALEASITESADEFALLWATAIFVGTFAAGFAAWYRRFLRTQQERSRANRAAREREQAVKAKEQARADKAAAREARRTGSS